MAHVASLRITSETNLEWLFTVARHRCIDELRHKHSLPFSLMEMADQDTEESFVASLPDPDPLPEQVAEQHELQCVLRQAIDELPFKYRQVMLLRYAGQLHIWEMSRILNIPEPTVKTYLHRAKLVLRTKLSSPADSSSQKD